MVLRVIRLKKRAVSFLLLSLILCVSGYFATSAATLPSTFGYEGYLTNTSGVAQTGTTTMTVRIYDVPSGGTPIFIEDEGAHYVSNGYFSLTIGSVGDVSPSTTAVALSDLKFDKAYYVTVEMGAPFSTGEMLLSSGQRSPFNAVPYAVTAYGVTATTSSASLIQGQGKMYYDTTAGRLFVNDGSTWQPIAIKGQSIETLNGLASTTQFFTVTNTGASDITLTSLINTHTLNIPDAGPTSRGVISTTTQSIAGNKTFTGTSTFATTTITKATISDLTSASGTINNLITTNSTSTTGWFSSALSALSASFTNLNSSNGTIASLISTNSTISTLVAGNLTATGTSTLATTTVTNLTSASGTITNLFSTNSTSTTGWFSSLLSALTASFTNLTATNATTTNATSTYLFANNGVINSLASTLATITGLNVTNSTTTNAIITNTLANTGTTTLATTTISNLTVSGQTNLTNASTTNLTVSGTLYATSFSGNTSSTNSSTTNLSVANSLYTSLMKGSVPFISDAGLLTQDNPNFFYDAVNGRLGLGTTTPSQRLSVVGGVSMQGSIIPTADKTFDLGAVGLAWRSIYVGPGSLYVNGQKVLQTDVGNNVLMTADINQSLILQTSGSGNIEFNPTGIGGQILLKGDVVLSGGKHFRTSDVTPVNFTDGILAGNLTISQNQILATNTNGGISLTPNGNGGVYVTNGNFGIGTTNPTSPLTVIGASSLGGNVTATGTLVVVGTTTLATTTITNASIASLTSASGTIANLTSTNSTSTTGWFSSLLSALTASFTNLTATNATTTNATSTYLFANNGVINSLASTLATITGLNVTNSTTTNAVITNALTTTGTSTFATTTVATLATTGALNASSTLAVTGAVTLYTTLNVGGLSTLSNLSFVNATGTGILSVNTSSSTNLIAGNATTTNLSTTRLSIANLFGSALPVGCTTGTSKLLYDSTTGLFTCGVDSGSTGGFLTNLNGSGSSTQFFATSVSGGLTFNINTAVDTHTFTLGVDATHSLPLTASSTNWNSFFSNPISYFVSTSPNLTFTSTSTLNFSTTPTFTSLTITGTSSLGNATSTSFATGNFTATGTVSLATTTSKDISPLTTDTFSLGTLSSRFLNLFAKYIYATSSVIDNSTSTNSFAQSGAVNNFAFSNATGTGIVSVNTSSSTNLLATNATSTNIYSTNGVIVNSTSTTGWFSSLLSALTASFTNLTATNATTTNLVTGAFTTTGTSTLATTTITTLNITGKTILANASSTGGITTTDLYTTNASTTNLSFLNASSTSGLTTGSLYSSYANLGTILGTTGLFSGALSASSTLGVTGATTLYSSLTAVSGLINLASTTISKLTLTGGLYDSTNLAGTLGQVLWSTGTSTQWVATSSLGIGGQLSGGAPGFLTRWLTNTTIGTSSLLDNGIVAGINATSSTVTFLVQGEPGINPFSVASSTGANLFNILGNGNVGIGTTNPGSTLEVAGTTTATTFSLGSNPYILDPTGNTSPGTFSLNYSTAGNDYGIGLGAVRNARYDMWFQTGGANGGGYRWYVKGVEKMTVDNLGNLGVGTISPGAKLDVAGNLNVSSASGGANTGMKLTQVAENAAPASSYASIDFSVPTTGLTGQFFSTANNYSSTSNIPANSLGLWSEATAGSLSLGAGGASGDIRFTTGGYTLTNERMRILSSGNVGIGTTSPISTLSVTGTAGKNPLTIASSTGASLFTILQNGNVGIGTTTPSQRLDVWGNLNIATGSVPTLFANTATGNVGIGTSNPSQLLHIASALNTSQVLIENSATAVNNSADKGLQFLLKGPIWNSSGGAEWMEGGLQMVPYLYNTPTTVSKLSFLVGSDNTAPTEKMYITSSGIFGINGGADFAGPSLSDTYSVKIRNTAASAGGTPQNSNKLVFEGRAWNSAQGDISNQAYLQLLNKTENANPITERLGFFTQAGVVGGAFTENLSILNTGNVGIGTTTPQQKLSVIGDISSTGNIYTPYQTAFYQNDLTQNWGANSIRPYLAKSWTDSAGGDFTYLGSTGNSSNGAQTAMLLTANAGVKFGRGLDTPASNFAAGTEWMRITTAGNIGIGTTSPQAKLDISNATAHTLINGGDSDTIPSLAFASISGGGIGDWANSIYGFAFLYRTTDGNLELDRKNGSTSGNQVLTVQRSTGNIGIGVTNPSAILSVTDNAGTGGTEKNIAIFNEIGSGAQSPALAIQSNGTTGLKFTHTNAFTRAFMDFNYSGASSLAFGLAGSEKMTILANGNVGIGTTSPQDQLHVNGNLRVSYIPDNTNYYMNITPTVRGPGVVDYVFKTHNLLTDYSSLTLGGDGNVGIGTTSPAQKLQVAGSLGLGAPGSTLGSILFYNASNAYTTTLRSSSTQTFNFTLTLPNATGTLGQALTTDGSGNMYWASASISGGVPGFATRWLTSNTLGTSSLLDDGLVSGINATSSLYEFTVQGGVGVNPFNVASSSGASLLTVLSNGNVGIGTTTPTAPLTVTGSSPNLVATSSGATVTYAGGYTIHTFTNTAGGTFTVTSGSGPVEVLVVGGGGGGGGGANSGGGGGAGGVQYSISNFVSAGSYPITIGSGGAGGTNTANGGNGNPSSFNGITSSGGGGGAYTGNGGSGASGGGGSYGGSSTGGAGTQGNNGGNGGVASYFSAGGGGGAGGAGINSSGLSGGAGGIGVSYSISGVPTWYAGGGGGGGQNTPSSGGSGIGGNSGSPNTSANYNGGPGAFGTGSGGGGGGYSYGVGGNGGSGTVIIRYKSAPSGAVVTGNMSVGTTTATLAKLAVQGTNNDTILNVLSAAGQSILTMLSSGYLGVGTTTPSAQLHASSFPGVRATGGTITYANGYTIHTFTTGGTFTVTSGSGPVEVLVVGGGGGGGTGTSNSGTGGGGAGGFVYQTNTASTTLSTQAYTVGVGNGGNAGTNGVNSTFNGIIAYGGGAGGVNTTPGAQGGSGGGSASYGAPSTKGGSSIFGQGNEGGGGQIGGSYNGAGGGGAGGPGISGNNSGTLAGGPGLTSSITGASVLYAGGGGGGGQTVGPGGSGIGGSGSSSGSGGNGAANTGSGGGGGVWTGGANVGGTGGSGIVIIRYRTASAVFEDGVVINGATSTINGNLVINGTSGGPCIFSGTLSCSSDYRLKQNITSLDNTFLTKITKLRAVTYNWNSLASTDQTTQHTGFIAQEVQKILPESVSTVYHDPTMGDVYGIDYASLVVPTIKALQELNAKETISSSTLFSLVDLVGAHYLEASSTFATLVTNLNASTTELQAQITNISATTTSLTSQLTSIESKINLTNATSNAMTITSLGLVGIGNDGTQIGNELLRVSGRIRAVGFDIDSAADISEVFKADAQLDAGTVVGFSSSTYTWSPYGRNSRVTYEMSGIREADMSHKAFGVVTTEAGIILGSTFSTSTTNTVAVSLVGRVPVKVTNENGAVTEGDYLTLSTSTPGYAMKQTENGQTLGRALSSASSTLATTTVLVLIENTNHTVTLSDIDGLSVLSLATSTATTTSSSVASLISNALTHGVSIVNDYISIKLHAVVAYIDTIFAREVYAQDKICVGKTCLTETELQKIINNLPAPVVTTSTSTSTSSGGSTTPSGTSSSTTATSTSTTSTSTTTTSTSTLASPSNASTTVLPSSGTSSSTSTTATTTTTASTTPDTTPPVITINGNNPDTVTVSTSTSYVDAGATALDAIDGIRPVTTTGTVNQAVVGTYTITYTATDLSNNQATATRTVDVK